MGSSRGSEMEWTIRVATAARFGTGEPSKPGSGSLVEAAVPRRRDSRIGRPAAGTTGDAGPRYRGAGPQADARARAVLQAGRQPGHPGRVGAAAEERGVP